ncbi:flippase [Pedobacter agri]|uniref:flippase n=1 Tax=Pedobacter agri TaxID=454586 RepID=UPI00293029AB|nr:flippase [Pedobacter agri]
MSLKKNLLSNFILTSSTIVLPLITFPYITRTLSNASLGNVFFIDSFTQYFILFASLGIPFYGLREVAKLKGNKQISSNLVIELVALQLFLSLFYIIIFFILGLFVPKLVDNIRLIEIGSLMILSNSFSIEWFYQGIEKFSYITKRSLIFKILSVIAILVFVKNKYDSGIYYFILASVMIANAIVNFGYFFKNHFAGFKFEVNIMRHLKPLLVLFSINASLSIYVILDSIILGFLTDALNVSYYNIPLKLVKIFWMIISGVGLVFIPRISFLHKTNNKEEIKNLISKSISIVLLFSLPFSFFCILFPEQILMIISGSKYLKSSMALQILSIMPLIIGLCNVFGTQFLLPIGKERKILVATIIGLTVSLIINFVLIPSIGFLGSAIAAVIAEISVCLYVFLAAKKEIKIFIDYKLLIQIFCCLFSTLILFLIYKRHFIGIPLMVTTFGSFLIFFLVSQIFFKNNFLSSLININKILKRKL